MGGGGVTRLAFVLDEDVDARCCVPIQHRGHDAWTIPQAARSASTDTSVAVYAAERNAVVVTHDREAMTRQERPIGRFVHLKCPEYEAAELLQDALPEIEDLLAHTSYVIIALSRRSNGTVNINPRFGSERRRTT